MKKLFVKYSDGSSVTYDFKNSEDTGKQVERHLADAESIILQKYPKTKYKPIIIK